MTDDQPRLVGRSSSSFTRVVRIFAQELKISYTFEIAPDLTDLQPSAYGGNPALQIPVLQIAPGSQLFGSLPICRWFGRQSSASRRVLWPEDLDTNALRNAHALTVSAMAAEVSLIMVRAQIGDDNPYAQKLQHALRNMMIWLDDFAASQLKAGLDPSRLSFLEVSLYCLIEHLEFREVLDLSEQASLRQFATAFARRESAQRTLYTFDATNTFR